MFRENVPAPTVPVPTVPIPLPVSPGTVLPAVESPLPPAPQAPLIQSDEQRLSDYSGKTRKKVIKEPSDEPVAPKRPVVSKSDAEKILEPKILACMKQHQVHYLIVRIGQGYGKLKQGEQSPLTIVEESYVDYKPTPRFDKSPLGQCILSAAGQVQTSAIRGNYMYFGLRNSSVPDPLADVPESIDRQEAEKALLALDDEARECAKRFPDGSRPGETLSTSVKFQGFDGRVERVEPYYIKTKSPFGKCIVATYKKATVSKFRRLDETIVHQLTP